MKDKDKKIVYILLCIILGLVIAFTLLIVLTPQKISKPQKTYNEFLEAVANNEVQKVSINFASSTFRYTDLEGKTYITDNPKIQNFKETLLRKNIEVEELGESIWGKIITLVLNIVLLYVVFSLLVKTMMPKTQKVKAVTAIPKITFDDIAGHKELKKDLEFVVNYLKNPKQYTDIGARMPKGVILNGPPGTGKTLTAKAIAGTAGVPFFSISGSDFIELYVGLGAKRVRELYRMARKNAPCIIFIDEIDAVGGKRNRISSHDESRQTVNALLGELDGFSGTEGVLTICATNNVDVLDEALIRPGRFDKHFVVPLPNQDDRVELLQIHAQGKAFSPDIDWKDIAAMTIGFSGASIESMLNEAALIAANQGQQQILARDVDRAFYKTIMKGDIKETQSTTDKKELEIVAWHEAGHALATKLLTDDKVSKVTIMPSTSGAGGATIRAPKERTLYSKKYLEALIKITYAGRIAEKLLLGDDDNITTGAVDDIKKATALIKEYVSTYGMDEQIGLLNLSMFEKLGEDKLLQQASELSKRLYNEAEQLLSENYHIIEAIASKLLSQTTITEVELVELMHQQAYMSAKQKFKKEVLTLKQEFS